MAVEALEGHTSYNRAPWTQPAFSVLSPRLIVGIFVLSVAALAVRGIAVAHPTVAGDEY